MQRTEITLTNKELESVNQQFEITNQTMQQQQFETTFFNMITLNLENLNYVKKDGNTGHAAMAGILMDLKEGYFLGEYGRILNDAYVKDLLLDIRMQQQNEETTEKLELDAILIEHEVYSLARTLFENLKLEPYNRAEQLKKMGDFYRKTSEQQLNQIVSWYEQHATYDFKLIEDQLIFNDKRNAIYEVNLSELVYRNMIDEEFKYFYRMLKGEFNTLGSLNRYEQWFLQDDFKIEKYVTDFYNKHEELLSGYFENLYRIIVHIEETQFLTETERANYYEILKAQMSPAEMQFTFYNVLYNLKFEKFKDILKDKGFFSNRITETQHYWPFDQERAASLDKAFNAKILQQKKAQSLKLKEQQTRENKLDMRVSR